MATIEIDGKSLEVNDGSMIIEAADAAGIYIPRFCYHKKLSIAANCRMCLVEVEKAPKPLPACATPVADGMKISTHSELAVEAQKGTMEFLLINHPLDCPVCDQGGECPLQDQALGFGKGESRYVEGKRVVDNKDIGPLVSTEMTRCIHCTRCVRFGQEVAGVMELGTIGRGENMEIDVFLGDSVDTELSGNMIDLCPVGALTSKPYRFSARVWELDGKPSISPHDSLGSNLELQSIRNEVKRVLPVENHDVNECWLSDRDRFSYEGVNAPDRLLAPELALHQGPSYDDTRDDARSASSVSDWQTALQAAADGLRRVVAQHGAESIAVMISPSATTEEHYLMQRIIRTLGSGNIDHRLRQSDFRADVSRRFGPRLGRSVSSIDALSTCLLVGCNIRKEQPLMSARLRQAVKAGGTVVDINPVAFDFNFKSGERIITSPSTTVAALAQVAIALGDATDTVVPESIRIHATGGSDAVGHVAVRIAEQLQAAKTEQGAIILGALARQSEQYSLLTEIAVWLADVSGASFGEIPEANSVGAWVAGSVHHRDPMAHDTAARGRNPNQLLRPESADDRPKAWILFGVEPELDCIEGTIAREALNDADFVVHLTSFAKDPAAHVALPIAAFAENEGSYVNCEGRVQHFCETVPCQGESRPGWKILRVLGNLLSIPSFDYVKVEDIRAEIDWSRADQMDSALSNLTVLESVQHGHVKASDAAATARPGDGLCERILDVPMYRIDATVRRANALQLTPDNPLPSVRMNARDRETLNLADGDRVSVVAEGGGRVELDLTTDSRIPDRCVYIPSGWAQTADLSASRRVTVQRVLVSETES